MSCVVVHTGATDRQGHIDFLMEWDPANYDNQSPIAVARLLVSGHTGDINAGGKYTDWRTVPDEKRFAMMATWSSLVAPEAVFATTFLGSK